MGDFIKTEHVTTLIAVLAILVLGLALTVAVMYPNGTSQKNNNGIVIVTASGTSEQYPAQGVIYVDVNGTGNTEQIATANLSLSMAKINNTVFSYIGNNSENIQTQQYYVNKIKNTSLYQVNEYAMITILNSSNINNAISALSKINNVYVTSTDAQFSKQQITTMRNQALTYALENATQQAMILTDNASLTPENITVGQLHFQIFAAPAVQSQGMSSNLFYYGNQELTETVTVTFSRNN